MGPIQVVVEDGNNLVLEVTPTPDTTVILDRGIAGPPGPAGDGDVDGPALSTDNAIARFDGTTGKVIQSSNVTINDSGNLTYSAGTANGVAYLNGSKVLTTGSALVYDGSLFYVVGAGGQRTTDAAAANGFEVVPGSTNNVLSYNRTTAGYLPIRWRAGIQSWEINNAEQMRLTSTGLGIGTSSPQVKLHIEQANTCTARITSTGNSNLDLVATATTVEVGSPNGVNLLFKTSNLERMRLDTSGNLGLGVTPSAWGTSSSLIKAFQTTYNAVNQDDAGGWNITHNAYQSAASNVYTAIVSAGASRYRQSAGGHFWFSGSGTAGNAITFTQAMTLDASGRLGVGTTSPAQQLQVKSSSGGTTARFSNVNTGNFIDFTETNTDTRLGYVGTTDGTNWRVHNDKNGFLAFDTNNTERARINSSGAWSYGSSGTATGAIGEVLTSQGPSAPPVWAAGGGGGYTYEPLTYTYTGTLDAEPFVILTAPFPAQSGVTVESQTGVWVSAITLSTLNQQLTSIEFTNLRGLFSSFFVSSMSSLTTLSFPALTTANTALNINNNAALTTLSLPALTTVNSNFGPSSMAALTTLSLPALTTVNGAFNPSSMGALTTMSLPALTTVFGNFNPGSLALITTLSLPALITIGGAFTLQAMASLTTISLPSIRSIEGSRTSAGNSIQFVSSTASLSSFTLGSTLKNVGGTAGNVVFTSCALNQASVDNILVRLAALDGTNGTTSFNNRTVTITGTSATPSATGLAAKATLVARGCTVTHN